jgi:hypothetical protein
MLTASLPTRTKRSTQCPALIILLLGLPWLTLLSKPQHDCGQMLAKRIWRARNTFITGGATMPAHWQSWRSRADLYRMTHACLN